MPTLAQSTDTPLPRPAPAPTSLSLAGTPPITPLVHKSASPRSTTPTSASGEPASGFRSKPTAPPPPQSPQQSRSLSWHGSLLLPSLPRSSATRSPDQTPAALAV